MTARPFVFNNNWKFYWQIYFWNPFYYFKPVVTIFLTILAYFNFSNIEVLALMLVLTLMV